MALTTWRSPLDEYLDEPWSHRRLVPYWRRPDIHWRDDFDLGLSTRWPREVDVFDRQMREVDRIMHRETVTTTTAAGAPVSSVWDDFQVSLDVWQFRPYEIFVKVKDDLITVFGNHDERRNGHDFSRRFTKEYVLPHGIDPKTVIAEVSSDGVLTIRASLLRPLGTGERYLKIYQSALPARHSVKAIDFI